ncbi:MAG: twin-arginine translocase subunit TatC [Bacteroidales bacterium]|nr:twin-arginine translocase subunit TatC [Candidatus Colicola coprequi]
MTTLRKRKFDSSNMSFGAHLDVLRGVLVRCVLAWAITTVGAFLLRTPLFTILLAPSRPDFITWRLLEKIGVSSFADSLYSNSSISLISTELTGQFMTHVHISLWTGFLLALPFIIWQLYQFVQPALTEVSRSSSFHRPLICVSAVVLFFVGVLLNYGIIFPFAYRFLITYQVSESVANMITLTSYIGTFLTLSLLMGVLFELPLLAWILASVGLLRASILRRYRKHAVVLIVILAAIITPTGDAFTLLLVSIPIYFLYELSIGIVARVNNKCDLH